MNKPTTNGILREARTCKVCAVHLPHAPRPVLAASGHSRILIIGQAPGRKVHESGIPWQDASGKTLREWLGVSAKEFYDPLLFAFLPMGFCFPGSGKAGDLPPRPECAPLWHGRLLATMPDIRLRMLIGKYATNHYLPGNRKATLTELVRNATGEESETILPLPHPSPRNRRWVVSNPWFVEERIPMLRERVRKILDRAPQE